VTHGGVLDATTDRTFGRDQGGRRLGSFTANTGMTKLVERVWPAVRAIKPESGQFDGGGDSRSGHTRIPCKPVWRSLVEGLSTQNAGQHFRVSFDPRQPGSRHS
jgi:hypothetical protein